jgi:hypothetical protein
MDAREAKAPPRLRWADENDKGRGFGVGAYGGILPVLDIDEFLPVDLEGCVYRPAVLAEPPDYAALAEACESAIWHLYADKAGEFWDTAAGIAAIKAVLENQ